MGAVLLAFLALTCFKLKSPAFVADELWDESTAALWAADLKANGRWPLSAILEGYPAHHGQLTRALLFPYLSILGSSYAVLKLWTVLFGVLTLLAAYLLVRRAFGASPALLTVLLLVVHPSFVGAFRLRPNTYMLFFSTASLLLLHKAWRDGSKGYLAGGPCSSAWGWGSGCGSGGTRRRWRPRPS